MRSTVHQIQAYSLRPYIQYILYNQGEPTVLQSTCSYPNTNICVGLIHRHKLVRSGNVFHPIDHPSIYCYSSGLYDRPHNFVNTPSWDEICIDFTPIGYYHFFSLPSRPKIFGDGLVDELFNDFEKEQWREIFNEPALDQRTMLIEELLLQKKSAFEQNNFRELIHLIHQHHGKMTIKDLMSYSKISERKIVRLFFDHLGIKPSIYIRIVKIRQAIRQSLSLPDINLTQIAYQAGYADQSHFVKEAKTFCQIRPKQIRTHLAAIDSQVIISKF